MRIAVAWTVGAIAIPAVAPTAHAQSASEQAAAEALFKQARDLMAAGDFAQACPKLVESERLDPSAGTMLNLANCYEKNGQIASAWVTFKGAAAAAQKANEPDRAKLARARGAKLESRLSTLTITVGAQADLPGLVITRDEDHVGRAEWGTPIPVDPGMHAVEASAPGHKTWETQAKVDGPGAKASVEVPPLATETSGAAAPSAASSATTTPPVAAPTSPPPPEPAPAPPAASHPGSAQRVVGVVVGAAGVAGVAVGSIFGVIAKSHTSDAVPHCDGTECDATGISALNEARSTATASTIAFIAGGAALAAGIVVYLVAPRPSAKAAVFVGPGAAGSVAGLTLGGSW